MKLLSIKIKYSEKNMSASGAKQTINIILKIFRKSKLYSFLKTADDNFQL